MNPKVLYLTYDGLTDPLGQSQILPYLEGLSYKGYHITIVSFEKPDKFARQKTAIENIIQNAGLTWYPQIYHKRPPIIATLLDVRKMKKVAFRLYRNQSFQLVHCRSYIPALVGLKLKRKFGVKFIFDMRGFWPDERVEGGLWDLKNPVYRLIYRYFKRKERQFLQQADQIISLTTTGKEIIQNLSDLTHPLPPIHVIPCCVDLNLFQPKAGIDKKMPEWGNPPEGFLLTYLGSIGTWYMLPEMLLFFKILLHYQPKARFLFISQDDPKIIHKEASRQEITTENITIKPAKRQEVPLLLKQSDASIAFIQPVYSKKASSPTKLGEVLAIGVPIITNAGVGDNDRIIQQGENGFIINNLNQEGFHYFFQNNDLKQHHNPENIRKTAKKWFALDQGILNYDRVYRNMGN